MRTAPLLLACCALAACNFHLGTSTPGSHGNATFSYASCLFGCGTDQPMMLGTDEGIAVSGDSIPALVATSSAPDVVAVESISRECCDANQSCQTIDSGDLCPSGDKTSSFVVRVRTEAVGSSDLTLRQTDGTVWDAVTLFVERPTSLALTCDDAPGPVSLRVNDACGLGWTAKDQDGRELMATTGVLLTSADPTIAAFGQFLGEPTGSTEGVQGFLGSTIVGLSPGTTTVTASASGTTAQLAVHVTK